MAKLVLIDVSSWLHRAFHAFPPLSRQDGMPTGALLGCVQTLFSQINGGELRDATHAIAVFDGIGRTFRHRIDASYKAGRTRHDDLRPQFEAAAVAFGAFGIATVRQDGVEADDIIAALAIDARDFDDRMDVVILSTDKDLTQLIGSGVVMVDGIGATKSRVMDSAAVFDKWGVTPGHMADLLALTGDSADGVKGIPGIGPKTAAALLALPDCSDLADLIANSASIPNERQRMLVSIHHQAAREAYRLIKLPSPDCPPIPAFDRFACQFSPGGIDVGKVLAFCDTYEFKAFAQTVRDAWTAAAVPGRELV